MGIRSINTWLIKSLQPLCHKMGMGRGNILVYLVVVILIFGVLGVTMVSLFSTSISSSATTNYDRRAFFLYESGLRYAASELINNTPDFSSATIDTLNATAYNLSPSGTFRLRVFGQRFESESLLNPGAAGNSLNLRVEKGEIPDDYTVPTEAPRISVVNYNYFSSPTGDASAEISGFSRTDNTHFSLTIADSLVIGRGELVSFAAPSRSNLDQNGITAGGELFLEPQAGNILPINSGAVEIDRNLYFYRKWVPESGYVKLVGLQSPDNKFPLDVARDTYVLLSPQNYAVLPEGRSGEVTYGWKWDPKFVGNLHELTLQPLSRKPDIEFAEEENLPSILDLNVSPINSSFIGVDNTQKSIVISGSSGFGSVLFDDTRPIGGRTNFCVADTIPEDGFNRTGCLFERGIRVFFILDFNYQNLTNNNADGLTFSIINGTLNDSNSVGGDFQLSELLAYAGDSRLDNNSTPTFLDGSGEGIEPPKMAVEFDGRSNNATLSICSNATTVNVNTRNDPTTDAVHYVFWGKNTSIDAPCRNNNKTYDDNRHDFIERKWLFNTYLNAPVRSSPAIDPSDGTIYFGTGDPGTLGEARIYALDSNGTPKPGWPYNPPDEGDDDVEGDPVLDSSRNVYIGSDANFVFRFDQGRSPSPPEWPDPVTPNLNGQVEGRPAIFGNRVYVNTEGSFFAFDKDSGTEIWRRDIGNSTSFQLSSPIVTPGGTIYVGSMNGNLYSISSSGSVNFVFSTTGPILATPVRNPSSGDIYVAVRGILYSVSSGGAIYTFDAGGAEIVATPAIAGTTVYVGSTNGTLYAIDTNTRALKWRYPATGNLASILSSPFIDPEGAIVFGASDGHLYAVQDKGTRGELFWNFPETGNIGAVESSPARDVNSGIIYFGSDDGHLYAVEPAFSNPRNLKNPYLNSTEIGATVGDTDNWLKGGPWAVRMEITRNKDVPNANGNYDYTLRTWMRQCNTNCTNVLGTFYQDTRVEYQYARSGVRVLEQLIELSPEDHSRFSRFIFGFTSATSVSQSISIERFQLSFIRPNDPIISSDPSWP
jgi:hypothetical protein